VISRLVTLIKHPHLVTQKYLRRLVHRGVFPIYDENYDECWGQTCYEGKTVLDLGADYGSTAYYFLKKGAKKVIAVEGNESFVSKLNRNYGEDLRVTCVMKWISNSSDIEELIKFYPSELVKVDIEGGEKHIVKVSPEILLSVKEWLIEAHTKEVYDELSKVFLDLGFKVFASNYDMNGVYKIIHACKERKREKEA